MTFKFMTLDLETGGPSGYQTLEDGTRVHGAAHHPILEIVAVMMDTGLNVLSREIL